jgi:FHA domain-containing protein
MVGRVAAPATPPPSVSRVDAGTAMPPAPPTASAAASAAGWEASAGAAASIPPKPDAARVAPAAPGTEADLLWQAFREGAGLGPTFTGRLTPEFMRVVGRMLRESVHGTRQLVQVRATTKAELRAAVTMIQSTQNNPLKFSPDTQSALEQMLSPPLRGFLDGPQAVTDAMDDLAGHLIGTLAGMRAALDGMLDRFEPKAVEGKLVETRLLDSVLPHARKARLWELYLQHYAGLREQAQEDFHTVFGKAFLAAYEQQVERLEAERHARPASR